MDSASSNHFTWAGTGQSQTTYTFSLWIKFNSLKTAWQEILGSGSSGSYFSTFRYRLNQLEWGTHHSGSWSGYHQTTRKLRDPSAWYHLVTAVDTTSAAPDQRQQTWINGELITAFDSSTNYTANYATDINQTMALGASYMGSAGDYISGYIAEFHYLDGTAGIPSDFGTENSDGVWIPIDLTAHSLSYGTNGAHLNFENSSNLGEDSSGNGNNWTVSTSAPTQTTDTPTDSGSTIGNYCTANTIGARLHSSTKGDNASWTWTNGNLTGSHTASGGDSAQPFTQLLQPGNKYHFEYTLDTAEGIYAAIVTVLCPLSHWEATAANPSTQTGSFFASIANGSSVSNSAKFSNVALTAPTNKQSAGDRATFEVDMSTIGSTDIELFYNGATDTTWSSMAFSDEPYVLAWSCGTETDRDGTCTWNFGQLGFDDTPSTGFKAISTFSMSAPSISKPSDQFLPMLYEGNGGGQRVGNFVPFTDSHTVDDSALFDSGDSDYLTRTPTVIGNRRTWTFSTWIKRGKLGVAAELFDAYPSTDDRFLFGFTSSDTIWILSDVATTRTLYAESNAVFRNPSAWLHLMCVLDTTESTSANRIKLFVNGVQQTFSGSPTYPSQNYDQEINNTVQHAIGRIDKPGDPSGYFDGYTAEVIFIDGAALTPSSFGQTDTSTNRWIPIEFDSTGVTGYGGDVIPTMSGATTPSGWEASADSSEASQQPWMAFDANDTNTAWRSNSKPSWIQIEVPVARTITGYTITGLWTGDLTRNWATWTLEGSNTGAFSGEEDVLDTVTGESGWTNLEKNFFVVDDPGSYLYYRFDVTANQGHASWVSAVGIDLYEASSGYGTNGFYLNMESAAMLGLDETSDDNASGSTNSAASEWEGATGNFTFTGSNITNGSSNSGIYTGGTFRGDFFIQGDLTNGGGSTNNLALGIFDYNEIGTVNTGVGNVGMSSMTNSFWIYTTPDTDEIDTYYGSALQSTENWTSGNTVKINRTGSTVTLLVEDSVVHTWSQSSTGLLKAARGQNNTGDDSNTVSWTGISANNSYAMNNMTSANQTVDTPTKNFATLNPNESKYTLSNGNLTVGTTSTQGRSIATIAPTSGKWYFEFEQGADANVITGFSKPDASLISTRLYDSNGLGWAQVDIGQESGTTVITQNGSSNQIHTYRGNNGTGAINVMVALDIDNLLIWYGKGGTWFDSMIPPSGFATIGDCTDGAGEAAAFDNDYPKTWANSARSDGSPTSAYIGKDWGSADENKKKIAGFWIEGSSNDALVVPGYTTTVALYGSDSAPSNSTDGTAITGGSFAATDANSKEFFKLSGITTSTAYRYHWVHISSAYGGADVAVAQLQFYELTDVANGIGGATILPLSGGYAPAVRPWSSAGGTMNFGSSASGTNYTAPTDFNLFNQDNVAANTAGITGLSWIKNRDATDEHILQDRVRGVYEYLESSTTDAEATDTNSVQRFLQQGVQIGNMNAVNTSAESFVLWQWVANGTGSSNTDGDLASSVSVNSTAGFSVVSYTGHSASTASTVGHGLGATADLVIVKNRAVADGWSVYHKDCGATEELRFTTTAASANSAIWNDVAPSTSAPWVFTVGTSHSTNGPSEAMIAYVFKEIEGYSKFGKYEGNSETDGPFINTGFRPVYLMIKNIDASANWVLNDAIRSPYNPAIKHLAANSNGVEYDEANALDILSNGFKLRTDASGSINGDYTYIYVAFAENPFGGSGVAQAKAR